MPQATAELQKEWMLDTNSQSAGEFEATQYLFRAGYSLTSRWNWLKPEPSHPVTEKELSAATFMLQEWDYGGIISELDEHGGEKVMCAPEFSVTEVDKRNSLTYLSPEQRLARLKKEHKLLDSLPGFCNRLISEFRQIEESMKR